MRPWLPIGRTDLAIQNIILLILLSKLVSSAFIGQDREKVSNEKQQLKHLPSVCPDQCMCNGTYYATCDFKFETFSLYDVSEKIIIINVSLSGNFSDIPHELHNHVKMERFKLTNSLIETLSHTSLQLLGSIRYLDLSLNSIKHLPTRMLKDLPDILTLNISHNQITTIPRDAFQEAVKVEVIDLSFNNLIYVEEELFHSTRSLRVLRLNNNDIRHVKVRSFENLQSLEFLHLDNNKIISLSAHTLLPLTSLQMLRLANNMWECSCAINSLREYLFNNSAIVKDVAKAKCTSPIAFKGRSLMSLPTDHILPCLPPVVSVLSQGQIFPIRSNIRIACDTPDYPQTHVYWRSPWGQTFAHRNVGFDWSKLNMSIKETRKYHWPLEPNTVVSVEADGALTIDNFRSWCNGEFTCVALNNGGQDNQTINVLAYSAIKVTQITSVTYCGIGPVAMLVVAFIVYIAKLCRKHICTCQCSCKCCCCCQDAEKDANQESKRSTLESYQSVLQEDLDEKGTPKYFFGSPFTSSKKYCTTPTSEDHESNDGWTITESLEEVKLRLDKKLERVRKNYQSIKESGSQYITTIKDTGSQAANRVRAGMVLGVEQVKAGMMSMKEFCGTGDMGTGTISVISVSTDVDSKEQTKVIKSVTYV